MKKIFTVPFLCLIASLFGCQMEEYAEPNVIAEQSMKTVSIAVGIDSQNTKASLDSQTGAFSWQNGDVISVLSTDGKFYDFILEEGKNEKTAEFTGLIPETEDVTTVAVYPRITSNGADAVDFLSDNILHYVLPTEWDYVEGASNVPMVASFKTGANHMSFKQVGGVMRFPVKNLPKEAEFVVTMNDKTITGQFPVNINELGESAMTAGSEPSVLTINYSSDIDYASTEINIPVPTGVYNNFKVEVKDASANVIFTKNYKADNKVNRSTLLIMKELVLPEPELQFNSFEINGVTASQLDEKFITVRLPYGTDVTSLKPSFQTTFGKVYLNEKEILSGSVIDFSSPKEFTIVADDGREEKYIVSISYSDIPVVYINTKNAAPIVSKEDWLKGTDIYITNAGEYSEIYTSAQIKGRGNTTWGYPKKPYAIKLDSKDDVLGMPKHKRWVLLANYLDKTCIRNSIAFEISRRSSAIAWTPRGYHVDVVLNGVFMGNYFLCEQIKIDENRVNITEMEATDINEESITGGYLLELDKNMDENFCFYTPARPDRPIELPIMVKEPEDPSAEQRIWLQNYITEVETALYSEGSTTEDYLKYIDLDSFIDYWLVYELTGTGEPTQPKSVYMWKERGGKIHAGPVWDFDYYTFQSAYRKQLINTNAVWNNRIINDPSNRSAIKARWMESRAKYQTILEEIDRQYALVKESAEYNATLWPVDPLFYVYVSYSQTYVDPNREKDLTVEQSVDNIKTYYNRKFQYMESYFSAY